MSQRPPASRPVSRSPSDGQQLSLPPVQIRDEFQQGGHRVETQLSDQFEGRGYPQVLPSPQSVRASQASTPGEEWRSLPSRDLGVHSMLNPPVLEGTPSSSRRVSLSNAESPSSVGGPGTYFGASPTTGIPLPLSGYEASAGTPPMQDAHRAPSPHGHGALVPRRILTPRSLAARLGKGTQPQGTIDAQRSPFLHQRGRAYIAEPGHNAASEIPPIPSPPERSQAHYGFPGPAQTADRRTSSMPAMNAQGRAPLSQSVSPTMSTSSANQPPSQTPPGSFSYGGPPQTNAPYYPGSKFAPQTVPQGGGGLQYQAPAAPGTEGPYSRAPPSSVSAGSAGGSASSSRQTSASDPIQVLTINTSQGSYRVPVDVHQASRLADEKRARNAGASARFRQRRKEKEKEASTTIEKMQQQNRELERRVREIEQERDFYRSERNRMRDVLTRNPETAPIALQGPPSPQAMRAGPFRDPFASSQAPAPQTQMGFQPQSQDSAPSERAPRRRRTGPSGEFTSINYTLPPASTLAPVQAGFPVSAPEPITLPPLQMETATAQPAARANLTPPTTAGPPHFDSFPRGYERGWGGDGRRQ